MSDATTKQVAVTWDAVAPASYATAGSYIVSGTIAGTTLKASATVTVTPAVTILGVTSVSALNATTVTATLATAKAGAVPADFTVTVADAPVAVTAAVPNADNTNYTLTVALKGTEGALKVNGTASASAIDYKAPTVKTVTPVSSTQFDITYSEPVNAGLAQVLSNYALVQAGTANVLTNQITGVTVLSSTKVRVTVNATMLVKDTSYTVSVSNMQDMSANKNTMTSSSSMNFVAILDVTKPTLVSAVATDANKIVIQMSEEMKTAGTATVQKYKADGTLDTAVVNTVALDPTDPTRMLVTITNSADYMLNGTNYQATIAGGSDLEGNAIAASQNVTFVGLRDDIAPTVTSTTFAANKVTIALSEKMDTTVLTNPANYYVFNSATGAPVTTGYTVTKNTANTAVYLTFNAGVLDSATNYSVTISGQKDAAITPNNLAAPTVVTFKTDVAAATPVKVTSAVAGSDGTSVVLTLAGTLTKAEAETIANYAIVDATDATKVLAVTKATYNSATQVTLTTGAQVEGSANYKVTMSNFANLSTVATETTSTFSGVDTVKPTVTGVAQLGLSNIDLVFSENMTADQTSATVSAVETGTANVVATTALGTTSGHDNKIRVAFPTPLVAGKNYTFTITGAKDTATQPNASTAQTTTFTAVADTTAPTIANVVSSNSATIQVTFNEEIANTGTLAAANFILKKGTTTVAWAPNTTFVIDPTDKTKLNIINGGSTNPVALYENGAAYTVTAVADANYVTDVAGNKVDNASYAFTGVADIVKPTVVGATMLSTDDTKLVVTFSENIKSTGFNANDYVVTNANTGVPIAVTAESVGTGTKANQITLTLASSTVKGTSYRVYVANASSNIKDFEVVGNLVDTNNATALFTGIDTVPVDVAAATEKLTSASTMTLAFGEKVDPASITAADFSVNALTVTNAVVQANGTDVVLTFTGNTDTALVPTVKLVDGAKIADISGNVSTGATGGTTIGGAYTDAAKPVLVSQAKTDARTIVLTFSEALANTTDATTLTVPGYTVSGVAVTNNGVTLAITVTTDMLIGNKPTVTVTNASGAIKDVATIANVYAGGDSVIAGEVAQPVAPLGVAKTDETIALANDGTLTGVAIGQEYQVNGTGAWTPITGSTVTALAPGSYKVRVAATTAVQAGIATAAYVIAAGL